MATTTGSLRPRLGKRLRGRPQILSGGDRILLKCGDTWQKDELYPHGSGTAPGCTRSPFGLMGWETGRSSMAWTVISDRIPIHLNDDEGYRIIGVEFNRCMTGIYAEYSDTSANRKYLWIDSCFFHDSLLYQHSIPPTKDRHSSLRGLRPEYGTLTGWQGLPCRAQHYCINARSHASPTITG